MRYDLDSKKDIQLSPPNNPDFGDLSTNLALSLSKDYIRDLDNITGSLETYDPYCLGVF